MQPACYNPRIMWRDRWRFWLAGLMLIALPLKGLAAIGVLLCCPLGEPAALAAPHTAVDAHAAHAAHAAHGAPAVAEVHADHGAGAPSDEHSHTDAGAKLKPLCCGGAAMTADAPQLALAAPEGAEPLAHAGGDYLSAWLPGADKPPRS